MSSACLPNKRLVSTFVTTLTPYGDNCSFRSLHDLGHVCPGTPARHYAGEECGGRDGFPVDSDGLPCSSLAYRVLEDVHSFSFPRPIMLSTDV